MASLDADSQDQEIECEGEGELVLRDGQYLETIPLRQDAERRALRVFELQRRLYDARDFLAALRTHSPDLTLIEIRHALEAEFNKRLFCHVDLSDTYSTVGPGLAPGEFNWCAECDRFRDEVVNHSTLTGNWINHYVTLEEVRRKRGGSLRTVVPSPRDWKNHHMTGVIKQADYLGAVCFGNISEELRNGSPKDREFLEKVEKFIAEGEKTVQESVTAMMMDWKKSVRKELGITKTKQEKMKAARDKGIREGVKKFCRVE